MYIVKIDPHTHTLFSGHAFSTIGENVAIAAKLGLTGIGMSDHCSPLFMQMRNGLPDWGPMMDMAALPKLIYGVKIFASVEIDIVDFNGHIAFWNVYPPFRDKEKKPQSLAERLLETRDYAIASVHYFDGCKYGTVVQNTSMYCNVLQNPYIHIIGHPGRAGLPFDIDEVLKCARDQGKIIEINSHSFDSSEPVPSICRKIALRCAELGVSIVVSSDAHSCCYVGEFGRALSMLEEIHFPQELIANESIEKFMNIIKKPRNNGK